MIIGICFFCQKEFRKRERKYKFCSLVCSNRYNLNGLNKVLLPDKSSQLAEFICICLGDGHVSPYQVSVRLNSIADKEYAVYVRNLVIRLFPGATNSFMPHSMYNAVDIRVNSRMVAVFLRDMGIISNMKIIPSWIFEDPSYIKACIRGLFDTEGSISFKVYKSSVYKQLNFTNVDIQLMTFVRNNLVAFGLKPTMTLKRSLYLSNKRDIDAFREIIGFSNPKLFQRSIIYDIDAYAKLIKTSIVEP